VAADVNDISSWFNHGIAQQAVFMLVVCDTYDHEDYPVFASDDAEAMELINEYRADTWSQLMEVYDLRLDKAEQMSKTRAWNMPKGAQ
jgi:hypothetical protein